MCHEEYMRAALALAKEAAAAGIPYDRFCGMILEKSLEKYN